MANPWERYQVPSQGAAAKPWERYKSAVPGSPEDDARRLAQGGRTFADQSEIAQRDADAYEAAIAANQSGRQLGRDVALAGRSILRGVANIPDVVVAPLTEFVNYLGEKPETTQSLVTGKRERHFPRQMNLTESADYVADLLGAPRPETSRERVLSDINTAITGGASGVGIARQLAQRSPGVVSNIGRLLSERPGSQIVGAGTGAGASGVTRESGGGQGAQIAAGLAGSLVPSIGPVSAAGASGALARSVPEARKEIAREAQKLGIQLTPAQLSDSRFVKFAQSMLRSVPFTGAQSRYKEQVGQFNRAIARTIGEDADNIGPEVFSRAKVRQSELFDELTARNALKVDDKMVRSLTNIAESAKISPSVAGDVESAIERLYAQATTGDGGVVIPGAAYQAFDSELNSIIRNGGSPAHFLGQVQSAVRSAMDRSISPRDAKAWQTLRREYGTRKALTPLASKAAEGEIAPAQVMGAATSTRAGKEAMATGRAPLGRLARAGQLMKEPPSSGTAERGFVGTMLGGATYIDPVTGGLTAVALNLLSRGLDSGGLAKLMIRENPGMNMDTALEVIKRSMVPAAVVTQQQGNFYPKKEKEK